MMKTMDNTYEILKKVFDPQNGTINISPDNTYEVFKVIFDETNESLRVKITGDIILTSPNGTKFNLSVDNNGNLITTQI